jgi:hypothetical protein
MKYYNNEQKRSSMEYQVPAVFVASLCHRCNIAISMG